MVRRAEDGKIKSEEAKRHPDRGKILRCLGASGNVTVDTFIQNDKERQLTLYIGDTLLFCSDGLTSEVPDSDIIDCIRESNNAKDACRKLIDLANYKGGGDNISIIIVKVCQESSSLETKGS